MHSPREIGRMAALLLWRSLALVLCALGAMASLAWLGRSGWAWLLTAGQGALVAVGIADLVQRRRAVLRNYPIIGHLRYWAESIRPAIRQ
jgi:hypothetical protein